MSILKELDKREQEEREELARVEVNIASLSEVFTFLEFFSIDPVAFESLPESF